MNQSLFHVAALGNAIVDVLVSVEDQVLSDLGVIKGIMTLVDEAEGERLYQALPAGLECSGGSAANTVVGIASLGGRAAYIGKVKNDQLGQIFSHDIRKSGVTFQTIPAQDGPATARCLVAVSPDAQRSMLTYLGACINLTPEDVDAEIIKNSAVTYLEGYLYDPPLAKQAFLRAAEIAHGAGRLVSLSLSDPFCVDRHRQAFQELVSGHIDILFANEDEIKSLYQASDFDDAVAQARGKAQITVVTRGAAGSVVITAEDTITVGADPVDRVTDTTGAGDLFAAGFLYGFTQGRDLATCAVLGGIAAGEVISHIGARPARQLSDLVSEKLGAAFSSSIS